MIKNAVISNLLEIIKTEISRLKGKQGISLEEYLRNWEIQHIVERSFQQTIQACIDIGARIISKENFPTSDDYHGIFEILFQEKVLSSELAQKMKEMVGFRNALIHEYRVIKHEEVYRHLKESLDVFSKFSIQILDYLSF